MNHQLLAVLVAALAVAPAGDLASAAASPAGDGCTLPLGDPDDESDGALVMLLDGSLSSIEQAGRAADLVAVLDSATAEQQLSVSLGSFGGSDADVHFDRCLDGVAFVARGNNERTRERNRQPLLDGAAELIEALPSGYDSSDPVAALRAGVERLGGDRERVRVLVIHTDGIPTAGCAALPDPVDVSEPGVVERLVEACAGDGRLPDAAGIEIVIGGIARTDVDLDDDVVTFLIELNTELCAATGATCRVDPNFPTEV